MKKVNAVLAFVTMAVMLAHTGVMCYSLLTGWYNPIVCNYLGYAAMALLVAHAIISIIIMFFFHEGVSIRKHPRENIRTIFQRASSILILLMFHTHNKVFSFMASHEKIDAGGFAVRIIVEAIYFLALATHISTSLSNAFVTLGIISKPSTQKVINIIAYIGMAAIASFAMFCEIFFFIGWLA